MILESALPNTFDLVSNESALSAAWITEKKKVIEVGRPPVVHPFLLEGET